MPKPFRLPAPAEVTDAERRLGVRFPADYRYFLLRGSDVCYGALEPAVVIPDAGHLDLTEVAAEAWEMGVSRELLPFCESNGDYYCLEPGGRVVYWSHDGGTDESWPDLAHWIKEVWIGEAGEEDDEE